MSAPSQAEQRQRLHNAVEWLREFRQNHQNARRRREDPQPVTQHEVNLARFVARHGEREDRKLARWFLPPEERRVLDAAGRTAQRMGGPMTVERMARKVTRDVLSLVQADVLAAVMDVMSKHAGATNDIVGGAIEQHISLVEIRIGMTESSKALAAKVAAHILTMLVRE